MSRKEDLEDFLDNREDLDAKILNEGNKDIKRFYSLDNSAYNEGCLSGRTKEMLGLVASMVLRCNDCIDYHTIKCYEEGVTKEEFYEVFNIALIVGGSIVIPHLRHAVNTLDILKELKEENNVDLDI